MSSRIIVIDGDEATQLLCLRALETAGHRVSCTGNPVEGLAMLDHESIDLLIVDVPLASPAPQFTSRNLQPHIENGMKVVQAAWRKHAVTPVLLISSHSNGTLLGKGVDGTRWPVLRKPFSPAALRTEVDVRLEAARHKTWVGHEPRKYRRYPIRCHVQYTGDHDGQGVVENLLLGGCLLTTQCSLEVDGHLTLHLMLPTDPIPMNIHVAVVRWTAPSKCGLEFVLIEEHAERLLSQYIKRFLVQG